jgi:hypothetical protein
MTIRKSYFIREKKCSFREGDRGVEKRRKRLMAFNKEQLRAYLEANKESLNAKRRERRRLAKLNKPLALNIRLQKSANRQGL